MVKKTKKSNKSGSGLRTTFKNIVSHTKKHLTNLKPKCKKALLELAFAAAKEFSDIPIKLPRIIPVPKTGGFLPLIPIVIELSDGHITVIKLLDEYITLLIKHMY